MRRTARALLLAMLCLACSSNVNSQSQGEAEKNLGEKAKDFLSKLQELKRRHANYEQKKRESPRDAGKIREAHKKDAKIFLEDSLIPSYEKLMDAHNEYGPTTTTTNDFESLKENFDGMKNNINAGDVTTAVNSYANKIISILPRVINSMGNTQPSSGVDPTHRPLPGVNNNEPSASDGSLLSSQYLLLLIPLSLSLIVSGAGLWWLKGQIDGLKGRIKALQQGASSGFAETANSISKLDALIMENKNSLESLQNRTLPALEANFNTSLAKVEKYQQAGRASESVIQAYDSAMPVANHPPQQMTVAEYLTRAGGDSIKAKKVLLRSDSLQEASDGDAIYILSPDERQRGMFKAIPNYPRFSSSQDYSHYAPFYDCDHPSSGEVRIVEPALATYDTESSKWRLYKKGKLQIS
jgi:hypothetical protein